MSELINVPLITQRAFDLAALGVLLTLTVIPGAVLVIGVCIEASRVFRRRRWPRTPDAEFGFLPAELTELGEYVSGSNRFEGM